MVGSNERGDIHPTQLELPFQPIEDNSRPALGPEEDLLLAVATEVIADIDAVHVLDQQETTEDYRREALQNFWGAKKYIASEFFEDDCQLAGINVVAAREALAPRLARARAVYGRWIRKCQSINLPVDEGEQE